MKSIEMSDSFHLYTLAYIICSFFQTPDAFYTCSKERTWNLVLSQNRVNEITYHIKLHTLQLAGARRQVIYDKMKKNIDDRNIK